MMRVVIVGAGHVGVCSGVALAERGHHVTLVDIDNGKLATLAQGIAPFHEPGLDLALAAAISSGRLRTGRLETVAPSADVILLCVGTPPSGGGPLDTRSLQNATSAIGRALRGCARAPIVATKSTVEPGTSATLVAPLLAEAAGIRIEVAANPEFLREGSALQDAREPDRIVIGADGERARRVMSELYANAGCPVLVVDTRTAELVKLASNAFLAARIALSNEMANVAEAAGADWYEVAKGVGLDARIGPAYLRAGAGFGGSCFAKDVGQLVHLARKAGVPSRILEGALDGNAEQPLVALRMLREEIGPLDGKRIALLGLAFKPGTDDVRETRALPIYEALRKAGADVVAHDPRAAENFARLSPGATCAASAEAALQDADGCIVQTEWPGYAALPPATFLSRMRVPVLIDARRTFDPSAMRAAGIRYRAIGLGVR